MDFGGHLGFKNQVFDYTFGTTTQSNDFCIWNRVFVVNEYILDILKSKMATKIHWGKNGLQITLEIRCLTPKVRYGTIVDDTPSYLATISLFSLADVIYCPLEVLPKQEGLISLHTKW